MRITSLLFWVLLCVACGLSIAQTAIPVDDRSNSLTYSPLSAWENGGQPDEYLGTTKWTLQAFAQVTIAFIGTGVQVYGTLDGTGDPPYTANSTYTLDGGSLQSFNGTVPIGVRTPGIALATYTNLVNKEHTLVIMNGGPGPTKYILDYIQYISDPTSLASNPSSTPDSPSSAISPALTGEIIGGVLGGTAVVVLFVFGIFFIMRKRPRRRNYRNNPGIFNLKLPNHSEHYNNPIPLTSTSYDTTPLRYLERSHSSNLSQPSLPPGFNNSVYSSSGGYPTTDDVPSYTNSPGINAAYGYDAPPPPPPLVAAATHQGYYR